MRVTVAALREQRHQLGPERQAAMRDGLRRAKTQHVSLVVAEAVASRETGMENIVGDASHGRGIVQLDDRWQADYLRSVRGCKPGTSEPIYPTALPKGRVPMISDGIYRMAVMLEEAIAAAKRIGVPDGHRLAFAIAAYNGGVGGATKGWHAGDVDRYTTGRDYSADVLERRDALLKLR